MTDDARRLSRMLWQARESLDMWAEVVESQAGRPDGYTRRLIKDIDDYRAERGWSSIGCGGEADSLGVLPTREALALAYHRYHCHAASPHTCTAVDQDDYDYADALAEVLAIGHQS